MRKQEGPLVLFSCLTITSGLILLFVRFLIDAFHFILRQKALNGKASAVDGAKKVRVRERERGRAVPAPEANAEIQTNLDVSHTRSCLCLSSFLPPLVFLFVLISYSFKSQVRAYVIDFHE